MFMTLWQRPEMGFISRVKTDLDDDNHMLQSSQVALF
jgi:hypothetical protein